MNTDLFWEEILRGIDNGKKFEYIRYSNDDVSVIQYSYRDEVSYVLKEFLNNCNTKTQYAINGIVLLSMMQKIGSNWKVSDK